ncbi:MAG: hypothetical protein R6U98_12615 [Pirellulaceae bacterium]
MKLNCISCGHTVDMRDSYDDYEGQVKCFVCGGLMAIRSQDGQIKRVELVPRPCRGRDSVLPESASM